MRGEKHMSTVTKSKAEEFIEKRREAADLRVMQEKFEVFYHQEAMWVMKSDTLSKLRREISDVKVEREKAEKELKTLIDSLTPEEIKEIKELSRKNLKKWKSQQNIRNQETLIYQYFRVHQGTIKTYASKPQNRL